MTDTGDPTALRRALAGELRRLRNAAGLTIKQVAEALEFSQSKVSRMETAQVGASPHDVSALAKLYGCDQEQRDRLMRLARDARAAWATGWWHAYVDVPSARSKYIVLEMAADRDPLLRGAAGSWAAADPRLRPGGHPGDVPAPSPAPG